MNPVNRILKVLIIFVILLWVLYLILPTYFVRALIFQKPGINDYTIFENNHVSAFDPIPWGNDSTYNKHKISESYMKEIESLKTVSFLIVQNKRLIFEKYWENYNENSISNSFSVAKSIVGLLIGCALDEGLIKNLDQKVWEFIPEFKKESTRELSIWHLLTMSSGVNWDESYNSLFSRTTKAYYGTELKKMIFELEGIESPGKVYRYLGINTQILALILESATGKSLSDFASEKLWGPIHAENDALWSMDRKRGSEKAYCCFNSTTRDFARIGQLVLDSGKWNNQQIVSWDYLKQAISPADGLVNENGRKLDYYGYQWWILNYKGSYIPFARGILGQYIFVIPSKNAVVVRLGHKRSDKYVNEVFPADIFLYLDASFEILD